MVIVKCYNSRKDINIYSASVFVREKLIDVYRNLDYDTMLEVLHLYKSHQKVIHINVRSRKDL